MEDRDLVTSSISNSRKQGRHFLAETSCSFILENNRIQLSEGSNLSKISSQPSLLSNLSMITH